MNESNIIPFNRPKNNQVAPLSEDATANEEETLVISDSGYEIRTKEIELALAEARNRAKTAIKLPPVAGVSNTDPETLIIYDVGFQKALQADKAQYGKTIFNVKLADPTDINSEFIIEVPSVIFQMLTQRSNAETPLPTKILLDGKICYILSKWGGVNNLTSLKC